MILLSFCSPAFMVSCFKNNKFKMKYDTKKKVALYKSIIALYFYTLEFMADRLTKTTTYQFCNTLVFSNHKYMFL